MYQKTIWVDQDVENPKTYRLKDVPNGKTLLYEAFGNVRELGTPIDAYHMNHIEDGIKETELQGISPYDSNGNYQTGYFTQYNGVLYKSLTDNNQGNKPDESPDNWEEFKSGLPVGNTLKVDNDGNLQNNSRTYIDYTGTNAVKITNPATDTDIVVPFDSMAYVVGAGSGNASSTRQVGIKIDNVYYDISVISGSASISIWGSITFFFKKGDIIQRPSNGAGTNWQVTFFPVTLETVESEV